MNFGFSFVGLLFLVMLFVPNMIWTKFKPVDYDSFSQNENPILLILERIGEVSITCLALFTDIKFSWSLLLFAALFLMILYEIHWIRYFKSNHTMEDMCRDFCFIPLPGATLPVFAFLLLGLYVDNVLLVVSAIILGIGHIGIHFNHRKEASLN